MKETSKNILRALRNAYWYQDHNSIGYPMDMIHDVAIVESINNEERKIFFFFVKRGYFSTYSLLPSRGMETSAYQGFISELESYETMIISYYGQVLAYDISEDASKNFYYRELITLICQGYQENIL